MGRIRTIKISHAGHPRRRLSSLQASNARKLRIVACYSGSEADCRWLELDTLILFGARPGSEWVKASLRSIAYHINALCEALG